MTAPGRGRYAIIPTHNRHEMVCALVGEMSTQVDLVIVVDNASTPPLAHSDLVHARDVRGGKGSIWTWHDGEQPPNLSRMWNACFLAAAAHADGRWTEWDIALLNDDAQVPAGWYALVAGAMRTSGAAAACCAANVHHALMKTEPDGEIGRRLYGPAFVIRGELATGPASPLWAEERLRWWFGDTDMDWKARRAGGTLIVPGPHVPNVHGNESTVGELAEQAGRDRATFAEIWGYAPW